MPSHALSDQKTADSNTALNTKLISHHMRLLAISYLHRCGVNIVVSHFRPCIRVSEISQFIVVYYRGHLDVTVFLRSLTVSETPTVDQNYFYNQPEIYFEKKSELILACFLVRCKLQAGLNISVNPSQKMLPFILLLHMYK